jgi:hypothetical protein
MKGVRYASRCDCSLARSVVSLRCADSESFKTPIRHYSTYILERVNRPLSPPLNQPCLHCEDFAQIDDPATYFERGELVDSSKHPPIRV